MGFTTPRGKLSRARPYTRVLCPPLITSTVAQCFVIVGFQLASLRLLASQPGYVRSRGSPDLHDTLVRMGRGAVPRLLRRAAGARLFLASHSPQR
jgi:hypothetical protein